MAEVNPNSIVRIAVQTAQTNSTPATPEPETQDAVVTSNSAAEDAQAADVAMEALDRVVNGWANFAGEETSHDEPEPTVPAGTGGVRPAPSSSTTTSTTPQGIEVTSSTETSPSTGTTPSPTPEELEAEIQRTRAAASAAAAAADSAEDKLDEAEEALDNFEDKKFLGASLHFGSLEHTNDKGSRIIINQDPKPYKVSLNFENLHFGGGKERETTSSSQTHSFATRAEAEAFMATASENREKELQRLQTQRDQAAAASARLEEQARLAEIAAREARRASHVIAVDEAADDLDAPETIETDTSIIRPFTVWSNEKGGGSSTHYSIPINELTFDGRPLVTGKEALDNPPRTNISFATQADAQAYLESLTPQPPEIDTPGVPGELLTPEEAALLGSGLNLNEIGTSSAQVIDGQLVTFGDNLPPTSSELNFSNLDHVSVKDGGFVAPLSGGPTLPGSTQLIWNHHSINTINVAGAEQGGITYGLIERNQELADHVYPPGAVPGEDGIQDLPPVLLGTLVRDAGVPVDRIDPIQLVAAANYIDRGESVDDRNERLAKALNSFVIIDTIGAPRLTDTQVDDIVSHTTGLSEGDFPGAQTVYQKIAMATNRPGNNQEVSYGSYQFELSVDENNQVTFADVEHEDRNFFDSFVDAVSNVGDVAVDLADQVAPFAAMVPGPIGMAAQVYVGLTVADQAIEDGNVLTAIGGAAIAVSGGAGLVGASGIATTASGVATIANGGIAIDSGDIVGGVATVVSGSNDAFNLGLSSDVVSSVNNAASISIAANNLQDGDPLSALGTALSVGGALTDGTTSTVLTDAGHVVNIVDAVEDGNILGAVVEGVGLTANHNPELQDTATGLSAAHNVFETQVNLSNAESAVSDAEAALAAAQQSGDPQAIAAAEQALEDAESGLVSAQFGALNSSVQFSNTVEELHASSEDAPIDPSAQDGSDFESEVGGGGLNGEMVTETAGPVSSPVPQGAEDGSDFESEVDGGLNGEIVTDVGGPTVTGPASPPSVLGIDHETEVGVVGANGETTDVAGTETTGVSNVSGVDFESEFGVDGSDSSLVEEVSEPIEPTGDDFEVELGISGLDIEHEPLITAGEVSTVDDYQLFIEDLQTRFPDATPLEINRAIRRYFYSDDGVRNTMGVFDDWLGDDADSVVPLSELAPILQGLPSNLVTTDGEELNLPHLTVGIDAFYDTANTDLSSMSPTELDEFLTYEIGQGLALTHVGDIGQAVIGSGLAFADWMTEKADNPPLLSPGLGLMALALDYATGGDGVDGAPTFQQALNQANYSQLLGNQMGLEIGLNMMLSGQELDLSSAINQQFNQVSEVQPDELLDISP